MDEVWNAKLEPYEDGYFDPYYDGFLYLFSLMHLSGNYQIIRPARQPSFICQPAQCILGAAALRVYRACTR